MPLADLMPYGTVCLNGNSVLTLTTSALVQITWPCDGLLVGIRATTRDGAAASAGGMLLRVIVNGQEELFPNAAGTGAAFIPFSQISGNGAVFARYHIRRPFQQATAWQVSFNNTTGGTLVADLGFDYVNTRSPHL